MALEPLPFCVSTYLETDSVFVRQGPGKNYDLVGGLQLGKCLTFWAVSEDRLWLLIAASQPDAEMQKFAGGWIRRDLLVPTGSVDLPSVTLTPTHTPSATATITPLPTQTSTETPTDTPTVPPTDTSTPTATETPAP